MRRKLRGLSRLAAGRTAMSAVVALVGALALIAGPAYADVTSSDYMIGAGTQVSGVVTSDTVPSPWPIFSLSSSRSRA